LYKTNHISHNEQLIEGASDVNRFVSTLIIFSIIGSSAYAGPNDSSSSENTATADALDNYGTELSTVVPYTAQMGENFIPAIETSLEYSDIATGEPVKVSMTIVNTENENEFDTAKLWMADALRRSNAQNIETDLVSISYSTDTADQIIAPEPSEWGVAADHVRLFSMPVKKMHAFSEWMKDQVTATQDKVQRLGITRNAEEREKLALEQNYQTSFDSFLKNMDEKKLAVKNPLPLLVGRPMTTMGYVKKSDATMAVIRFAATGSVFSLGIVVNDKLAAPVIAAIVDGIAVGAGSAGIQLGSKQYQTWFENKTGPVPTAFRKLVKGVAFLFGKRGADLEAIDKSYSEGMVHDIATKSTRYSVTEYPFLGLAAGVLLMFGVNMFANTPDWALHFLPNLDFIHMLHNVPLVLTAAVLKALGAQGLWDFGTAKTTAGLHSEVDTRVARGEISTEIGSRIKRRIDFKGSMRILGIAMASNLAVILGIPKNVVLQTIGDDMIWGLGITGAIFFGKSLINYHPVVTNRWNTLMGKLQPSWNRFKIKCADILDSSLETAASPATLYWIQQQQQLQQLQQLQQ
jgi:hypothetical protein